MMRSPGGDEHADQADIQEPGDRGPDLTDSGFASHLREPVEAGEVPGNLCGQQGMTRWLWERLARVGEQCQGIECLRGSDGAHRCALSRWLDTCAGCGSMRTVLVTCVRVTRRRTVLGGSACGSAQTLGPAGGRGRGRYRSTSTPPAMAARTTAASTPASAPGARDATGPTWNDLVWSGAGA